MSEKEKKNLVTEVNILRELRHPNIVKYVDKIIDRKRATVYIIMEFCEGGDLSKMIKRSKPASDWIAEDVIWKIFSQLVIALDACHNRP
jgi:serine/threonine protein kinase